MSRPCQGLSYLAWSILIFGLFCISRNSASDLGDPSIRVRAFQIGCVFGAILLGAAAEVSAYRECKKRREACNVIRPQKS